MHLDVQEVVKRYGGLTAVDGVSLTVPEGTVVGLIGPNGAGKTTLVQMIAGYCRVDSGRIIVDAIDISRLPPHAIARRGIARTFQNIRVFPEMTVAENVAMGTLYNRNARTNIATGRKRSARGLREPLRAVARAALRGNRAPASEHLELLGIASMSGRLAGTLAYGDQRRVEISRALATSPGVLLLDEPAAGMSSKEADELGGYISAIAASGVAVLLIEHNVRLVRTICGRICVMDQGRRIAWGSPDQIMADPAVMNAYLGTRA